MRSRPRLGKAHSLERPRFLNCQQLEDRINPVAVTTNQDNINPNDNVISLREAILEINDSGISGSINFSSSVFKSGAPPIILVGSLPQITQNIDFIGDSLSNTFVAIDGKGEHVALNTASGVSVTVSNLTIQNTLAGIGIDGGGTFTLNNLQFSNTFSSSNDTRAILAVNGSVTINGCTFEDYDISSDGGAIKVTGSALNISDTSFVNCTAANGGTIFADSSTVSISNSTIATSMAGGNGGAIALVESSKLTLTNVAISKSSAGGNGGAIDATEGTVTITGGSFTNTSATLDGGAVHIAAGSITTSSLFTDCTAVGNGGAISVDSGTLNSSGSFITCKALNGNGGAINFNGTTASITGGSFSSCTAFLDGGAVHVAVGNVTSTATYTGCTAGGNGGGIALDSGSLNASGSFTSCTATSGSGGAIFVDTSTILNIGFAITTTTLESCTAGFNGGGIYVIDPGNFDMLGVSISNCHAEGDGGGAYFSTTLNAKLEKVMITLSTAGSDGGGAYFGTTADTELEKVTVTLCSAGSDGGGLYALTNINLKATKLTVSLCTAVQYGGGLAFGTGEVTISEGDINYCSTTAASGGAGGGIYFSEPTLLAIKQDSKITYCKTSDFGGGIALFDDSIDTFNGHLEMSESSVEFCEATSGNGGGISIISSDHTVLNQSTIVDSTITNCTASVNGGGIYMNSQGTLLVENSSLSNNSAMAGSGGGAYLHARSFSFRDSTLHANSVGIDGGGFYYSQGGTDLGDPFDILRTTLSGNSANGRGGAIALNHPYFLMQQSTISDNYAGVAGGGINFDPASNDRWAIENSTFSANETLGFGGAMNIQDMGFLELKFVTAVLNKAGNGGALSLESATLTSLVTVDASVMAGSVQGMDFYAAVPLGTPSTIIFNHSIIGPISKLPSTLTIERTDTIEDADYSALKLEDLADNGGPTLTHQPKVNSPLIDFIPASAYDVATDQRGVPRPIDYNGTANHDIGSVEVYGVSNLAVTGYSVNDGAVQRSRLTTITVNFAQPVAASLFSLAGVITLTRTAATSAGTIGTIVQTGATGNNGRIVPSQTTGLVTSITLTFDNADTSNVTGGVEYGSLADGRWQLAIPIANYITPAGVTELRRLFGDINNDGTVDGPVDFAEFGSTYGLSMSHAAFIAAFDFNNDGTIDGSTDFAQFGARYGLTL